MLTGQRCADGQLGLHHLAAMRVDSWSSTPIAASGEEVQSPSLKYRDFGINHGNSSERSLVAHLPTTSVSAPKEASLAFAFDSQANTLCVGRDDHVIFTRIQLAKQIQHIDDQTIMRPRASVYSPPASVYSSTSSSLPSSKACSTGFLTSMIPVCFNLDGRSRLAMENQECSRMCLLTSRTRQTIAPPLALSLPRPSPAGHSPLRR